MLRKIFIYLLLIIGNGAIYLGAESATCEVYFSPRDHVTDRLIALIDQETKSIKMAIYSITNTRVVRALERAHNRGVHVEVVVDPYSVKAKSPLLHLVKSKVPLYVWDPPISYTAKTGKPVKALMHDKFSIFGSRLVWTGSFNFTYTADAHNEENVLTVDNEGIARKYLDHFNEIKIRGCRPFAEYQAIHPKKKSRKNNPLGYNKTNSQRETK